MDYLEIIKRMEQETGPEAKPDWRQGWRDLATITAGISSKDDPRYEKVMRWLDVATTAEILGSWDGFLEAMEELKLIMRGGS